jgi:hypothetical protein
LGFLPLILWTISIAKTSKDISKKPCSWTIVTLYHERGIVQFQEKKLTLFFILKEGSQLRMGPKVFQ